MSGYKPTLVMREKGEEGRDMISSMSGYKSMLVMRGTGEEGRDMINSIRVGTNLH